MVTFIRIIVYALGIYVLYLGILNFGILKVNPTSKTRYLNIGLMIVMAILTYGYELRDGIVIIMIAAYGPCFVKLAVDWYKNIP